MRITPSFCQTACGVRSVISMMSRLGSSLRIWAFLTSGMAISRARTSPASRNGRDCKPLTPAPLEDLRLVQFERPGNGDGVEPEAERAGDDVGGRAVRLHESVVLAAALRAKKADGGEKGEAEAEG